MASESVQSEAAKNWYARFVALLDPGEFLGELLFGLIMVLTFSLGPESSSAGMRMPRASS